MSKEAGFIERMTNRRSLQLWERHAATARDVDHDTLRSQVSLARKLRAKLNDVIFIADDRLATPIEGSMMFQKPKGTDWSWRPDIWRGQAWEWGIAGIPNGQRLLNDIAIYHDCHLTDLTYRQVRNTRDADLAPYGVRLDVFEFDGSFLSLAIDMPSHACTGLHKGHMFCVNLVVETERPLEIFGRLNIKHGPNVEQIVRELPIGAENAMFEFDLGDTKINEKLVKHIWLDLIFEGPQMNQITLRDVTISRTRRAEL